MRIPPIFVGHGSPINAIESAKTNQFANQWQKLGETIIPKPKAILCISAHWLTKGIFVTGQENPPTIHDFYGFPKELFEVEYNAAGKPNLAQSLATELADLSVELSFDWGFDHGCWSVLRHIYPNVDVPVVQLSIDVNRSLKEHFDISKRLRYLLNEGVMILGSGNIIHNLRLFNWNNQTEQPSWAIKFNERFHSLLNSRDFEGLLQLPFAFEEAKLAIPTLDHYLPFLYIAAQIDSTNTIEVFNDVIQSSLSMTSIRVM
ncbi:MAG: 4,5-DOPA dioxygenase extradiol [Leptonema sp. (in: Bacteria)]|nr:4,5-DOPA dioxygenase extradiol [Leptonema sp. (in: bacteria)]